MTPVDEYTEEILRRGALAMSRPPLSGHVIEPDRAELDRAAAIIAGHDFIHGRGEPDCLEFHSFVREVLATTVKPEIERLLAIISNAKLALGCEECE